MRGLIPVTNLERIRSLPPEELAPMLIQTASVDVGDEGYDGEWTSLFVDEFTALNGERYMDFDDAVEATIEWLSKEEDNGMCN